MNFHKRMYKSTIQQKMERKNNHNRNHYIIAEIFIKLERLAPLHATDSNLIKGITTDIANYCLQLYGNRF